MALSRLDRLGGDWPERWRRWLDLDSEPEGWMRVEQLQEDGHLVVRAELPGIDPERDVEVSVADGILHITAHREERSEHKGRHGYRSEFRYGSFSRDLPLPNGVQTDAIQAEYKDGILEVRAPWPTEVAPQATKIPINRS